MFWTGGGPLLLAAHRTRHIPHDQQPPDGFTVPLMTGSPTNTPSPSGHRGSLVGGCLPSRTALALARPRVTAYWPTSLQTPAALVTDPVPVKQSIK